MWLQLLPVNGNVYGINGYICDMSTNVAKVVDGYIIHMWTIYRPHSWHLIKSTFVVAPSGHKRGSVYETDDNCSDKPYYEIVIIPARSKIIFLETLKVSVVILLQKIFSDSINFNVEKCRFWPFSNLFFC